jgi:HD-GYP domain-containing protein (c-di-GMP phosphodiesterase class II)
MATLALTEVLAALSLATDLGSGFEPEKGLRTCVVAVAVARQAGLDEGDVADVFQAALLRALGCTAHAPENADHFGDDLAFQRVLHQLDPGDPATVAGFGAWAGDRATELREHFFAVAPAVGPVAARSGCEASQSLGTRLGLRPGAIRALDEVWERWDGRGIPDGVAGEDLTVAARVVHLAEQAVIGGPAAVGRRSGGHLDPALVALVTTDPEPLAAALGVSDPLAAGLAAEPAPKARVPETALDAIATVLADLADLKSRFTLGHSRGVAALAGEAAALCGLDRARVRRAALVHDVGRTSVPTGIWERPGPLSPGEEDRVRLHAYWSERVLSRAGALADVAALAGAHHERLDGSGYHRGAAAAALSREARVLAAADVLHALQEDRPHRPARDLAASAAVLEEEARAGRLDAAAVGAVLEAAGAPRPRRAWPADLTDREVEVLRLAARGLTNQAIADALVVSPRTVGHHLAHVYDKIGRRTRGGAALFAMEHGLLE